jgi:hypothetical protein
MTKSPKPTQGTKQRELSYEEILQIIAEQKENENAFPNSFAIKINKIFTCANPDENQSE